MKTLTIVLAFTLVLSACDKSDTDTVTLKDGTYTGQFFRTSPTGDWKVSKVKLTLNKGTFTGESEMNKYPAICNGTYTISNDTIVFKDQCVWTADFDWTLILSGTFEITVDGQAILLKRYFDQNMYDTYQLKPQTK